MDKTANYYILIPIPPLEIQQEIANYLDQLDTCFDQLINNLEKEVNLIERQYNSYKNKLISLIEY